VRILDLSWVLWGPIKKVRKFSVFADQHAVPMFLHLGFRLNSDWGRLFFCLYRPEGDCTGNQILAFDLDTSWNWGFGGPFLVLL
jgi:hypothetical protein